MYQHELFRNQAKGFKFLGSGVNAKVYGMTDNPDWVIKLSRNKDRTLNYLEWALANKKSGTPVSGAPDIDFIIHTDEGYICCIRKYEKCTTEPSWTWCEEQVEDVANAFNDFMLDTFAEEYSTGDIHEGNIMYCKLQGRWVLTDPSSCEYLTGQVTVFTLQ